MGVGSVEQVFQSILILILILIFILLLLVSCAVLDGQSGLYDAMVCIFPSFSLRAVHTKSHRNI